EDRRRDEGHDRLDGGRGRLAGHAREDDDVGPHRPDGVEGGVAAVALADDDDVAVRLQRPHQLGPAPGSGVDHHDPDTAHSTRPRRRSTAPSRAASPNCSFTMYASAPASRPSWWSSALLLEVRMTTGRLARSGWARTARVRSKPFMPGISTSVSRRSTRSRVSTPRAAWPSSAPSTR